MDSVYYVASIIGMGWLVIWAIRDEATSAKRRKRWSPFDMIDARPEETAPSIAPSRPGWRQRARRK